MGAAPASKDFTFMLSNAISVLKSALLILDSQVSMSSNVFTVLMTSIFLYISMRSWERHGKLVWSLPFLDCSQYSQLVPRTIFSIPTLFSKGWNSFCRISLAGGAGCKAGDRAPDLPPPPAPCGELIRLWAPWVATEPPGLQGSVTPCCGLVSPSFSHPSQDPAVGGSLQWPFLDN